MAGRTKLGARRICHALALSLLVSSVGIHAAPADSPVNAAHDLESSDDFRVRVSAALTLGRSHAPGARIALEHALGDIHPAVRIAAAAGLSALGDRAAVTALAQRLGVETANGVRTQINATIAALSTAQPGELNGGADWQGTRFVVTLGDMHNRSGVQGEHAIDVLRNATRERAKAIPGAMVGERTDSALVAQAAARHIPVLLLEGAVQRLAMGRKNTELSYNAQVDYSMRKVPQQQLRGMLSGSATSFGTVNALQDVSTVRLLADQAIEGAVESALRGAAQGFGDAVK